MVTLTAFCFALVVGFVGLVTYTQAAVDCKKRLNYRSVMKCCKIPKPNYAAYSKQCPVDESEKPPNPCVFDCIFNASHALQGDQLNMPNVRKMMSSLLNNDPEMVAAFNAGFEKCGPLVKKQLSEMKANGQGSQLKPPGLPNCQLLAVHYVMCAHKHVFTSSCPAKAWTKSTECENAKEYVRKCGDKGPPGSGRKRGDGKRSSGGRGIFQNRTVTQ